ncbi:hypothetical protein LC612_33680 [Nostoc sp. CHAB 5834]|nr:hypothetical protein [Nostoc sp. CHAB 5834]
MTPSIADKTPIPTKVWRQHTDPPALWISVIIGSVSLHLLAFWLIRSSNAFSLWFPQQSQSAVPIELIDIAPKTQSTAKKVSPKPASATQKSVLARSPQTSRTTPRNQDLGAINSADNLQQKSRTYASQPNSQFKQQRIPVSTVTPKAAATPKPTVTPTPTVPVGDLPWNRRQEIKLGRGMALPPGIPSTPPTPTRETPPTSTRETPSTPTRETPPTPTRETPPIPTRETPSTPTGGASVAIVAPLLRDEMINLIQRRGFRQDILPEVIASYTGSNAKQLDSSSFLSGDSEIKPAQILASFIIDRNGNFQQAVVLEIEPATLKSEKSTYERVLNDVFKTENFIAAHNKDGTKPDLSNLFVRIKIQLANSN